MSVGNGNRAFRNQIELRIEELRRRGSSDRRENSETEIAMLTAILDIHDQVTATREAAEKIARSVDSYPSLVWLIVKRPLSTIPYLLAGFIGLSALYISDIRGAILAEWGLPANLFDISAARIIPVFFFLLIVGFLADFRYRAEDEKKEGG